MNHDLQPKESAVLTWSNALRFSVRAFSQRRTDQVGGLPTRPRAIKSDVGVVIGVHYAIPSKCTLSLSLLNWIIFNALWRTPSPSRSLPTECTLPNALSRRAHSALWPAPAKRPKNGRQRKQSPKLSKHHHPNKVQSLSDDSRVIQNVSELLRMVQDDL